LNSETTTPATMPNVRPLWTAAATTGPHPQTVVISGIGRMSCSSLKISSEELISAQVSTRSATTTQVRRPASRLYW